jgi:uncharacterized protein (DUF952 family)
VRLIYHLVPRTVWEQTSAGAYCADSLATEGFIHCSNADQVARVANLFYADQSDLLVLTIDADRLASPLRDEDAGTGERFPHVYGPIEASAIIAVESLRRGQDNRWEFRG